MSERMLVAVAEPALDAGVRALAAQLGVEALGPDDRDLHLDLVVVDVGEAGARIAEATRQRSPLALTVVLAPAERLGEVRWTSGLYAAIPVEQVDSWLPELVRRAREERRLRGRAARLQTAVELLAPAIPEDLPSAIVEAAGRALGAEAALLLTRGTSGRLEIGAEWPPRARDRRAAGPHRPLVPLERLRRRSERLLRQPATAGATGAPVCAALGAETVALVLGSLARPHGILWALRPASSGAFGERHQRALAGIAQHASVALEHIRVVHELKSRISAMVATRDRFAEETRAAQTGRLAVDTLRRLQGPLAYLRTNLRFLTAAGELRPDSGSIAYLKYALEGLGRAERMLEDMQRVSENRDQVAIEARELVDAALSLARPLPLREHVEVQGHAVVRGQPARLAEALAELIRNAGQARGATRVDVRAARVGAEVSFEVSDDGEGIPDDVLARVSEPFFSTRGRSGLGLSTAGDIVEAAGGSLRLSSRPGIGTIAQILLPAERGGDTSLFEVDDDDDDDTEPS